MQKLSKKSLLKLFSITLCFISASTAYAGSWVDDWIDQKTVYNVGSFESSKRHFGSLGGASMRWQQGNDYLLTVTPPSFNRGCGGIDVFLGGFDFMKFEHLVEKMKRIMGPAAATFAFDTALEVLWPDGSQRIKAFTAIVDRLNSIQLDDCKASKAIVATLKDETGLGGKPDTEAVSNFMKTSGLKDLDYDIIKAAQGLSTEATVAPYGGKQAMVSGCPSEIRNVFFTEGSLMTNLAAEKGVSSSYINFIISLVGDIKISSTLTYNYVAPCDKNKKINIDAAMEGQLYIRNNANACVLMGSFMADGVSYPNIKSYVRTGISGIIQHVMDKTPLTPTQEAAMNTVPQFIFKSIQNDIARQGQNAVASDIADNYVDLLASLQTYSLLKDLMGTASNVLATSRTLKINKSGAQAATCQIELKDDAEAVLGSMLESLYKMQEDLEISYRHKSEDFFRYYAIANTKENEFRKTKEGIISEVTKNNN